MEKNLLKGIDKSDWQIFKFDEIAKKISKTVLPQESNADTYVGLEHIDSEDIHIRRTGVPADVIGGKLKCYPGDVIFGKRRAYQRRAAVVNFEGICSAHAFVFRSNNDVINQKLFPFFLHSDSFMNLMIDISVGGLSPTINWTHLKNQEFLLPPKKDQDKLTELFLAMDDVLESQKNILNGLKKLDFAQLKHFFFNYDSYDTIELKEIVSIKKGKKPTTLLDNGDGIPYCTLKYLRNNNLEYIVPQKDAVKLENIDENDLVVVWDGAAGDIISGKKGILASTMCKIIINDENYLKDYLFHVLRSKEYHLKNTVIGSAVPHVDGMVFEKIKVPILNKKKQINIIETFKIIRESIEHTNTQIFKSLNLQRSLINKIF